MLSRGESRRGRASQDCVRNATKTIGQHLHGGNGRDRAWVSREGGEGGAGTLQRQGEGCERNAAISSMLAPNMRDTLTACSTSLEVRPAGKCALLAGGGGVWMTSLHDHECQSRIFAERSVRLPTSYCPRAWTPLEQLRCEMRYRVSITPYNTGTKANRSPTATLNSSSQPVCLHAVDKYLHCPMQS